MKPFGWRSIRNPTVAEAATAILRAEALLQQARAATRPNVSAGITNVLIDGQRGFEGIVAQPRNQALFGVNLSMPVLAASQWAATAQARDQVEIARLSTADVRRQIAVATAQAYLTVISQVRQVEVNSSHTKPRRRISTTPSGGWPPAPGRVSTSCGRHRKCRQSPRAWNTCV